MRSTAFGNIGSLFPRAIRSKIIAGCKWASNWLSPIKSKRFSARASCRTSPSRSLLFSRTDDLHRDNVLEAARKLGHLTLAPVDVSRDFSPWSHGIEV